MKIIKKSKTFLVYRANGRLLFGFVRNRFALSGFACQWLFGAGAGYKGGCTAFFAWRSGSLRWQRAYRPNWQSSLLARLTSLEIGITRNANNVPYAAG